MQLTPAQAVSLYREAILPDAKAGNIGRWFVREPDESKSTNLAVSIYLKQDAKDRENSYWSPLWVTVEKDSENTLKWLKENLNLEPSEQVHGGHDDQQLEIAALPIEQPQNHQ